MVSIEVFKKLKKHYENNLAKYVKEHPEEYILLEDESKIKESFYKTEIELKEYISDKYGDNLGYTVFSEKIPKDVIYGT
ncbi:MAG: hypothetical protein ISS23_00600 [Nanoarchaeota archaeon]|nr:hypothetical protein [Nanoarchaeota archaeon]